MDPITTAGLVGAVSDVVGGVLGGNSAKEAQKQAQRHQVLMRGTHYQATVKDMKAAGLNPMMLASGGALSQGMGAGTAQSGQLGEGISKAGHSALNALLVKAQINDLNSSARAKQADADMIQQRREFERLDFQGEVGPYNWMQKGVDKVAPHPVDMDLWGSQRGARRARAMETAIAKDLAQTGAAKAGAAQSMAASLLADAQAKLVKEGIPEAKAMAELWRQYGATMAQGKTFLQFLKMLLGR